MVRILSPTTIADFCTKMFKKEFNSIQMIISTARGGAYPSEINPNTKRSVKHLLVGYRDLPSPIFR